MSQLIRMDRSGHSTLAEWTADDPESVQAARAVLAEQLEAGYLAVVAGADGAVEQVRELPPDAPQVILRRPIAGG
jgi:hypothetical protein